MRIYDLDDLGNDWYDTKNYIRRIDFSESEEEILIEALLHYEKIDQEYTDKKILLYMIRTLKEHLSL